MKFKKRKNQQPAVSELVRIKQKWKFVRRTDFHIIFKWEEGDIKYTAQIPLHCWLNCEPIQMYKRARGPRSVLMFYRENR